MAVGEGRLLFSAWFLVSVIFTVILIGTVVTADATVVNPHWTGKHCAECHVEDKAPELRYEDKVVELCNRCHGEVPSACTKVHISESGHSNTKKITIPEDWPLRDEKLICLTCHGVQLQMYGNTAKEANRNFLRGEPPVEPGTFCFNCHKEEYFQKINPHRFIGANDSSPPCFRCHTQDLVSGFETSFEASVKTKNPSLCIGCHWTLGEEHMNHVLLNADKLEEKRAVLDGLEQEGIDLPLPGGRMHCATCHNPHPPGVIGRKEAAAGAGEEFFLRIPGTQKLCRTCHPDGTVDEKIERFQKK
ncbi:MAG: hypothetical protein R3339_09820 [Thermodesulfobacteriota bacterium]|nr:hypothetical protein [Thermodesulfobacteriota bacterium]